MVQCANMMCLNCGRNAELFWENMLARCPTCGFIFVTPEERARQQALFIDTEVYSEVATKKLALKYPKDNHAKKDLYARTAVTLLSCIPLPPKDIRCIDVSGNGGFFSHALIEHGVLPEHVLISEMSPNYIALTKEYFGYPTLRGNIEKLTPSETFHICTMFDVLEHVADIPKTLQQIGSFLKPNGILFLKLPNGTWARFKSILARRFSSRDRVMSVLYLEPGGHLNYWNRKNVHEFEHRGFTVVESGYVRPTYQQFKKKYLFYIGWYWITQLFRLPLYPEFYVILRKEKHHD